MKTIKIALLLLSFSLQAETINVVVPNFPPFFDKSEKSGGIFVEMMKKVFDQIPDKKVIFEYYPHKRVDLEFKKKEFSVAANIVEIEKLKKNNAYISVPFFEFSDCFYSLKKNNIFITSLDSLKDHSLISYSGFNKFHGLKFEKRVMKLRDSSKFTYQELTDPYRISETIVRGRGEVGLSDLLLFIYSFSNMKDNPYKLKDINLACNIVSKEYSFLAFKSKALRDQFNKAYEKLEKTKSVSKILVNYKKMFNL